MPSRFTPGSQFGYSNDGYFVLGAIVAAVSGLSYYDYVRRHIFDPAGMTLQLLADRSAERALGVTVRLHFEGGRRSATVVPSITTFTEAAPIPDSSVASRTTVGASFSTSAS